jgi:hypothetical protein
MAAVISAEMMENLRISTRKPKSYTTNRSSFSNDVINSEYVTSNEWMAVSSELEGMLREAVVA